MLCVAVMLSVMVLGAGAAFSDQDKIENTEAVDACSVLNIIGGYEDGSFHPERNIKRSEITKMICVALNGGNEPNVSTNAVPTFSDVRGTSAEWAEGYIESCVAQGIVSGVGGGRFSPDGNVTGAQLAKMLLVSLGYNAETEKFTGNAWETNVNVRAAQKSLYDGLETMDTSAAVTRDQAAQMVWNALKAYEVEYKTNLVADENGNLTTQVVVQDKVVGDNNDKITLLRDKYDALVSIGTLVNIDKTDLTISMTAADALASDDPDVTAFSKLSKDYSSLMGQKVTVIYTADKSDKVLGVFASGDNTVYNVIANETSEDDGKVSFGGNSYSIDVNNGGILTYVDGGAPITTTLAELDSNALNPNAYTFVDSDGNGRLDTLIVKTYNVAQVTYVASDKIIAAGQTYKYADENIADGIAVDDWVVITPNLYNDNLDISKVDVQTGTLSALRTDTTDAIHFESNNNLGDRDYNEYQIGDTWYNGGEDIVQSTASENNLKTVKAGESVDYVAVNGIMFFIQKSSGEFNGKVDNVAMITTMANNGVEDLAKIQLFNGDTKTVTVGERAGSIDFDALNEGVVYEYTISGDKYYFEALEPGVGAGNEAYEEYYGDLSYRGDKVEGTDYTVATQSAAATQDKFDTLTIDDNAEVMLFSVQNDGSVSATTMTGKQYKNLDLTDIAGSSETLAATGTDTSPLTGTTGNVIAYAFSGTLGGLNRIGALAIQVEDDVDLGDLNFNTWSHYGFILENAKFINNNNKVMSYQLLTENGVIEVQEEYNTLANRQKGMAIGYGDITTADGVNTIDDVDLLNWTSTSSSIFFDAITKVSDDKDTVIFQGGGEQDISDAAILYVNTADSEGVENGALKTAIKDLNGDYLANALYLEINGSVELVIVEQTDYLRSTYYETNLANHYIGSNDVIYGKNAVTGNEKTVSFGALPSLTAGTAVNQTITINTANIDNGMAVTAQLVDSTGNNPVTNGTLAVSNGTVSNNTATITLTGTPADNTTDVYVKVSVDGQSALSSKLTINAAESNTVLKLAGTDDKSLAYAAAGNFTVTVGYENAWMQELKVSIKDSDNGDATTKFTTAFTTGGVIANNNAGTDTLKITEKSSAEIGTYTATVTLGDKSASFAFEVTASEIANADGLTFTLASDPTNSDTPDSLAVTPAKGGSEHYTVTSAKWFNGENEVTGSNTLGAGTVKLVIELTADANYKFASTATTSKQAGSSNKTATPSVAADGSTLTLTYEWTVV